MTFCFGFKERNTVTILVWVKIEASLGGKTTREEESGTWVLTAQRCDVAMMTQREFMVHHTVMLCMKVAEASSLSIQIVYSFLGRVRTTSGFHVLYRFL